MGTPKKVPLILGNPHFRAESIGLWVVELRVGGLGNSRVHRLTNLQGLLRHNLYITPIIMNSHRIGPYCGAGRCLGVVGFYDITPYDSLPITPPFFMGPSHPNPETLSFKRDAERTLGSHLA